MNGMMTMNNIDKIWSDSEINELIEKLRNLDWENEDASDEVKSLRMLIMQLSAMTKLDSYE